MELISIKVIKMELKGLINERFCEYSKCSKNKFGNII